MTDLFEEARKEADQAIKRSAFGWSHVACLAVLAFVACVDFDTVCTWDIKGIAQSFAPVLLFPALVIPLFRWLDGIEEQSKKSRYKG